MNMGDKVKDYLVKSGDTSYFLGREIGLVPKAINNIRDGSANPENLSLKTVFLVLAYFQGTDYERETLRKIRAVINSDLTSYRMAHMLRYVGNDGHEHLPSMQSIDMLRQGKKNLADVKVFSAERYLSIYDQMNADEPVK